MRKTIVLSLRVAPADNLAWRSAARRAGVPLGQFVRSAVNEKLRMTAVPTKMSLEVPYSRTTMCVHRVPGGVYCPSCDG